MAKNTLLDFKRLKPLTLDGVWYSDYGDGTGQYPFADDEPTHFYYWLVDNIPFLRLNERDALFTRLMNLGYISAFPYKNYASINLTDLTPVIVDMQNGYIHQDFAKQDLDTNETIGYVIANLNSGSTAYTDENNIFYYYVVLNINNVILPYSRIQIASSQNHATLIPEQTKLYLDLRGGYCTLSTPTEKISRLDDSQTEVAIEVGNIIRIDNSAGVCICNLSSSSFFGASTGLDSISHSNLEDVEAYEIKKSVSEDLPELYVYGHYGYQTKIIKFSTALGNTLSVGNPVQINSNGSISLYAGSNQFLGYVYYKKTLDNSIDYYIVTYGEYVVSDGGLEEGKAYFINNQGTLIPEDSANLTINCVKIGSALSSTVLLLESNNTSFYLNFLTNLGVTTYESTTKGEQVGLTLDSRGLPINNKFLYGNGAYGRFPIIFPPILPHNANANSILYEAGGTRATLTSLKRYAYGSSYVSPSTASWASGWSDTTCDKPMYGFVNQPPRLFIQKLAPEYDSSGDVRFDRLLIYLAAADIDNYTFLNALDVSATQNTNNWSPTFQSDLEAASHVISSLSVTALTYGATAELTITLTPATSDFTFTTPSVTGVSTGAKTYYPSSKGISLKPNNGVIAFYNSTYTPVCSSTIYCFYEKVESTGTSKQYKFTNCTLFNTRSLNTPTLTAVRPNSVISIPTGAFTIKTGGTSSPVIAGMFNPNPHLMTQFSKHTPYSCFAGYRYEHGWIWTHQCSQWVTKARDKWYSRRQLLSPLGLQPNYTFGAGTLYNTSAFKNTVYASLEASGNYSYPLYGALGSGMALSQNITIDTTYNFYRYIDIDTMYLNPHVTGSILSLITSELHDRYPIKLRLGCVAEPYVKSFYDSFMFGNAQNMTLGMCLRPTVGTSGYADYREHKTTGVGTIVYIARQNVDTVEDYVDIHLDPSALVYQILGDFGNHVPATGTVSSIDHPYNFDLICYVNGREYAYGVNDTIRVWLPPNDFNEDIRFDRVKEISTRQKPYLSLTYTSYQIGRPSWVNDLCYKLIYPTNPPSLEKGLNTDPTLYSRYTVGPVVPPHVGDGG